ncbi:MAG: hypothetical protein IH969_07400, partial [Candidatus Krumholzibacteriota bacterium]|nr:hypothetical protein [Candidatus Krumholzibacteriota bacterium]
MEPRRATEAPAGNLFFRAGLFLFVLGIVVLEFPGARELRESPDSGIETRNLRIVRLRDDSPNLAANIRVGDELREIEGEAIRNHIHYLEILSRNVAMSPQNYVLDRDGARVDVLITYEPRPGYLIALRFVFVVVAFAFLLVGLWVYLRRPDWLGSLLVTNCVILAFVLTDRPTASLPWMQILGELVHDAIILLFPAVVLHFFLVFSRPTDSTSPRWPRRMALLYGFPAALYLFGAVVAVLRFQLIPVSNAVLLVVLGLSTAYFAIYITGSLVVFVRRYRAAPQAQKQKLRVVIAGSLAGFVPILLVTVLRNVVQGEALATDTRLESAAALCLGFIPVTFAYAILKHGAIELNLVVRKSLVYAVLTGAIIAVYYVLVNLISDVMVEELGVSKFLWAPLSILFLSVMFAPARERIQHVIDRLFYRGEYVYQHEVYEFNRQIANRLTRDETTGYFTERIEALLKPAFMAVYHSVGSGKLELSA